MKTGKRVKTSIPFGMMAEQVLAEHKKLDNELVETNWQEKNIEEYMKMIEASSQKHLALLELFGLLEVMALDEQDQKVWNEDIAPLVGEVIVFLHGVLDSRINYRLTKNQQIFTPVKEVVKFI